MGNFNIIDTEVEVVDGLSILIMRHLNAQAHQEYCPDANPDSMDHKIADARKRVAALRRIREDFENVISGVVGIDKPDLSKLIGAHIHTEPLT